MEFKLNAFVSQMMVIGVVFVVTAHCGVIDSFDTNNESKCIKFIRIFCKFHQNSRKNGLTKKTNFVSFVI